MQNHPERKIKLLREYHWIFKLIACLNTVELLHSNRYILCWWKKTGNNHILHSCLAFFDFSVQQFLTVIGFSSVNGSALKFQFKLLIHISSPNVCKNVMLKREKKHLGIYRSLERYLLFIFKIIANSWIHWVLYTESKKRWKENSDKYLKKNYAYGKIVGSLEAIEA